MQILPLTDAPQHLDTITQWIWDEWRGGEARQTFDETRSALLDNRSTPPTLVALDASVPTGVLAFSRFMLGGREPPLLFINALFVLQAHRGRGVGTALLHEALARVGPDEACVYVYTGIRAWYQARGFDIVEENGETGNAVLRARTPCNSD